MKKWFSQTRYSDGQFFHSAIVRGFINRYGIFCVMALAVVLRIVKLKYAYYGTTGELYRDMLVVYKFLEHGIWPLLGPSSSLGGFYFGPIYYYLLVPFVWLWHFAPIGAVFTSAVFSILSVYVTYRFTLLWFSNKFIALLTGFFIAVSVRDIQNAYYISNPNLLPFFVTGFLYALIKVRQQLFDWKWWLVLGICFGIATQLHTTATVVLPLILLSCLATRLRIIPKRAYLILVTVVLFSYIPYAVYEFSHHFENIRRLFVLGGGNYGLVPQPHTLGAIISFFDSVFLFRNDFFNLYQSHPAVYFCLLPFYFVVVIWFIGWYRKNRNTALSLVPVNSESTIVVWWWFFWCMAMFLFFQQSVQFFYFLILWPLPVICLSWFVFWLYHNGSRLWVYTLVVYVLFQIIQVGFLFPVISRPEFDHASMVQLFSTIKSSSQGSGYSIINSYVDVNLFEYYAELLGIPTHGTVSNALFLYTITDTFNKDALEPNPERYIFVRDFYAPGMLVKQYKKRI